MRPSTPHNIEGIAVRCLARILTALINQSTDRSINESGMANKGRRSSLFLPLALSLALSPLVPPSPPLPPSLLHFLSPSFGYSPISKRTAAQSHHLPSTRSMRCSNDDAKQLSASTTDTAAAGKHRAGKHSSRVNLAWAPPLRCPERARLSPYMGPVSGLFRLCYSLFLFFPFFAPQPPGLLEGVLRELQGRLGRSYQLCRT